MDQDTLDDFLGRAIGDLGATIAAGGIVIGHRLGLYAALAAGSASPEDLAARTDCDTRYVTEWLRGQAAGGYIHYDSERAAYSLTDEQAFALANPNGGMYLPGGFVAALGALRSIDAITDAFRTGSGVGWDQHDSDLMIGTDLFFRPNYLTNLVPSWIPALDGVEDRLRAGANVADIGCGLGASTMLLAQRYPNSQFVGSDSHADSIEWARKRAADAGVADRVSFEVASAQTFSGSGYDLATTFDCLHDLGDPGGAAAHIREALAPDGVWMIVEPNASDHVAANFNPVGRIFYGFSTFVCVPNAKSQDGGSALGAQAGPTAVRRAATDAGFAQLRQVASTPFNIVYEAKP